MNNAVSGFNNAYRDANRALRAQRELSRELDSKRRSEAKSKSGSGWLVLIAVIVVLWLLYS